MSGTEAARVVCTVCARGGSKGLPGKNVRTLLGKPLIAWTVEAALGCEIFDAVIVTSDAPEILAVAADVGAELLVERPAELAGDRIDKLPAIVHAVREAERRTGLRFDVVVDLDVTAPIRVDEDIRGAVELLTSSGASNVITGSRARRSPYFNLVERRADGSVGLSKPPQQRVARRQDAPECFDMNASIYVWRREPFLEDPAVFYPDTVLYEMPEERSHDIDSETDFAIVETLMRRMKSP